MNRPNRNVYLLAGAMLLVAGCFEREHRVGSSSRATITRNWPASGIALVKVGEVDGNSVGVMRVVRLAPQAQRHSRSQRRLRRLKAMIEASGNGEVEQWHRQSGRTLRQ